MIVNELKLDQALGACGLHGTIPYTTLSYRVRTARKRGTYNDELAKKIGTVVEVSHEDASVLSRNISPVTMKSLSSDSTPAASTATSSVSSSRKSSRQVSLARLESKRCKTDYDGRYKAAFKDATNLVSANARTEPVHSILHRLNAQFKLDGRGKKLTRSTVYEATKNGLAGQSPKKRGPAPKVPSDFVALVATHAEVCQVGNGELKGRDVKRLIGASMVGTRHEHAFKVETVWKKVRNEHPDAFQAATKLSIEDARAQWTTHDNLNQWFDDAKSDLLRTGLVVDECVLDEMGGIISELRFLPDTERRIINMDETHHDLSITGDKGGSRAVSYHNPAFQRGANRGVKSSRHVTGAYATNSAGEALPPLYIFDSSAKLDENFRVRVQWLEGLPTVTGRFGCPTEVESSSFYAVRPRGSMDDSLLNQYIETVIVPLYPNMNKTAIFDPVSGRLNQGPVVLKVDAGPGRIVSSEAILLKREELYERGLIILMGLPNATSVQQEMDALYGAFKSGTYARGEKVVQEKLRQRGLARRRGEQLQGAAILNLDFSDLATIVNGVPDDRLCDRPFDCHFTKEKVLASWAKVGFVPFSRNCLNNVKVRKELGQHIKDKALESLQFRYDVLVDAVEETGFNPGIFDAVIPSAVHVQRAATEEAQVEELLQNGKAFSASGQWNHCDSRIGNAGVILKAQKKQLRLNKAARLQVESKKSELQLKTLEKAQLALKKYQTDGLSLNEKDWGDVVRWVLPEAKVTFLLKDLKKKEKILAKLATLPNDWTTYIPCSNATTAIPFTTV